MNDCFYHQRTLAEASVTTGSRTFLPFVHLLEEGATGPYQSLAVSPNAVVRSMEGDIRCACESETSGAPAVCGWAG